MNDLTFTQQVQTAIALIQRGNLAEAQPLVDQLLQVNDQQADLWALASDVALRQGRTRDAAIAADRAARLDPGSAALQVRNAHCQLLVGEVAAAKSAVHRALSKGGLSASQLAVVATVLLHCEDHEQASALYRQATTLDPRNVHALKGLAIVSLALGRIEDAESAAAQLLAVDPGDHEMWHFRSSLRRQTDASNHVDQLKAVLSRPIPSWRGAVQVFHALAKELEDLGRYEESFAYLKDGATLKRKHTQYNVADDVAMLREIHVAFDRATVASLRGNGNSSSEPIFVLGLPRTGSTLVERILSSHPDVHSAGELNAFAIELVKLTTAGNDGSPLQRALLPQAATRIDMQLLGTNYLQATRSITGHTPYFVDKMPMNALYVGLIHLALPNAKIVLVERDPADTCYAMYKFLFQNAYPFSYDLQEVAIYYLAHQELMAHWRSILPASAICRVEYEELVSDPESESRRIIHEIGLPWNNSCLDFTGNRQATTTGSASQVRQPIYRSSVGLWRHYRRQLDPMLRVLAAAGVDLS